MKTLLLIGAFVLASSAAYADKFLLILSSVGGKYHTEYYEYPDISIALSHKVETGYKYEIWQRWTSSMTLVMCSK